MPTFRILLLMLLAWAALPQPAAAQSVSGTATYRERIAPPPDARFVAILSDISRADAPAEELGRIEIEDAGPPPHVFEIAYDPDRIDPRHIYAVRATLWSGERMMFTTDTIVPVLTRGAPDRAEIVMVRVADEAAKAPGAGIGAHGLRLPASFTGRLPCADCTGVDWHLDLWPDQTWHLRRDWRGGAGGRRQDALGHWYADPARTAIALAGLTEGPALWRVAAPDRMLPLGPDGEPIAQAEDHALTSIGGLDETDLEGLFLGGLFTYMADAALFEECLTGRRYPVAQEGEYPALERAYLADRAGPGAALYVHVRGDLAMRPGMEGPERRSLVVRELVRTRPGITCERQRANAALTDTYWRIDSLEGEAVTRQPDTREPHLVLMGGEEPRFAATMGCNRMAGGYSREGGTLTFGAVAGTLMACPPPLDALERRLAQTLAAVRGHEISGETLILTGAEGEVIAQLTAVYF